MVLKYLVVVKLKRGFTLKDKFIGFMTLALALLVGCGSDKAGTFVTSTYYNPKAEATESLEATEKQADTSDETEGLSSDQFMIISNDMQSECLILEQIASGKQYMYNYSLTTDFLDKYGNRCSISQFDPGRVITIGDRDDKGRVGTVRISGQVWEYPDVSNYVVDTDRMVFKIGDESYSIWSDVFVNSDGQTVRLSDLTDLDTLRVIGYDKNILSISVTSGHGELQLINTEIFDGSFIQIGNKIFEKISPYLTIEIPEGTYTVSVANKGYGGSTDVTIERGKKQTLDLDSIKGDGPKTGQILFAVDVANAIILVDGDDIDYSEPVELTYGVHSLVVSAAGYETYSKKLVVNSGEATIVISMSDSDTSSDTSSSSGTTDSSTDTSSATAGSLAGSLAGSSSSSGTGTGSSSSASSLDDATINALVDELLDSDSSDYLSTYSELIKSLTGSSDD
jgi:hypothetical protein